MLARTLSLLALCSMFALIGASASYNEQSLGSVDTSSSSSSSSRNVLPSTEKEHDTPTSFDTPIGNDAAKTNHLDDDFLDYLLAWDNDEESQWNVTTLTGIVSRILASATDFASFNRLFQDAKLHLPDAKLIKKIVFNEFILDVSNLICYKVILEDLAVNYALDEWGALTLNATMQVFMDCDMDYWYGFGSVKGSGSLVARTSRNTLDSTLQVTAGGAGVPPSLAMNSCAASVDIIDLDFDGGVVAKIADIMEKMVANIVETQVSKLVCDQLSGLGSNMLKDAIAKLNKRMSLYLKPVPYNPLKLEHKTDFGPNILNLRAETGLGSLISIAVRQIDSLLSGRTSDVGGPTGTGSDLTLNIMLRDRFLENDRSFDLNVSSIANPTVLDRSDKLTNTRITIDAVKVYGLDTLKEFSGLDLIGNRTVQSKLQWDYVTVKIDMTVTMKASSRADSIIEGTSDREVIEQVTVVLGVDNLDVAVSLLLAVDEDKLGALELGSLLYSDRLVPCLLSSLDNITVTTLEVSVSDIKDPSIEGFVSAGFDLVISQLVKAALAVYEPTFLRAIPGVFQILVRNAINQQFLPDILSSSTCIPPTVVDEFVDLRDLLMAPEAARLQGGTGEQQYGDITHLLYQAVQDTFMAVGSDGLAGINEMLIRPVTIAQSGTEGVLRFGSKLISVEKSNVAMLAAEHVELSLSDFMVENVDALRSPLSLLETSKLPFETNNTFRVGNLFRDRLTASMRFLMAVVGKESPLSMSNEIVISASANSLTAGAIIQSILSSDMFQHFKIRYIMDVDCWFSMFPLRAADSPAFEISSFVATLASFTMNASCTACSSPGLAALPDLIDIITKSRAFPVVANGIEKLAEGYAAGGPVNSILHQMIESSHQRCPMSAAYEESANKKGWVLEIPDLPPESVDAFMFAAALAAEVGLTVFGLSHGTPHQFQNALSAQMSAAIADNIKLLDWTDLETSLGIGKLPDTVFSELRSMLSRVDSVGNLQINSLLEKSLLVDGVFKILPNLAVDMNGIVAQINSIEISGLNTFTTFDVLKPIAPQTLQNMIQLTSVGVHLAFSLGSADGEPQQLTVSFNATDISIDVAVFAAFDVEAMGSIKMESLFSLSSILPCLLSTASSFNMPRFVVAVGSLSAPVVEGLLPASSKALSTSISTIADRYGKNLTVAIPFITDGVVKATLNSYVNGLIASKAACGITSPAREAPVFVDFRDLLLSPDRSRKLGGSGQAPYGSVFAKLYDLLQERLFKVDSVSGLSRVNDVIVDKLTQSQSGSAGRLAFSDPFNSTTRINIGGLDATVLLRMFDAYLDDLDTFGDPMSLLSPVSGNELNNTATIGVGPSFRAGSRFIFGLASDNTDIYNDVSLDFGIDDLSVVANALIQVDDAAFRTFPFKDMLNQYCWLATIPAQPLDIHGVRLPRTLPSLSLVDLNARISQLNLNVTCMNCSSPGMADLAQLVSTHAATASLTESTNNLLGYVSKLLGGAYVQDALDRLLVESQRRCPHTENYEANIAPTKYQPFSTPEEEGSLALFLALALTVLTIAVFAWGMVFAIRYVVKRRNRRWLHQQPSNVVRRLWCMQIQRHHSEQYINDATSSLFRSPVIPRWVRLLMPLCVIVNIGLFISGHLQIAATVTIVATVGEQTVHAANFYDFSIARSTIEIWKAGGKALAMLILIVSGIWPYTKQLVTLLLWFAPTRSVSVSRREAILLWFDVLAKWSFVDIFVLVVTVAGFRVSVQSPDIDFLPKDFYSLDLLVVPLWGLYANMIAQMVSQISSHFIIHYHRKVIESAVGAQSCNVANLKTTETGVTVSESGSMLEPNETSCNTHESSVENGKEALCMHAYARPHRGSLDRLKARRSISPSMIFVGGLVSLLIILGCTLPVVSQDVLGIIGIMVESGQDFNNATSSYSLFSIIGMLFDQAKFTGRAADYIGLGSLSIVLISCVLIVPIVQTWTLLYQWFKPMTVRRRHRLSVAIECLEAWQYCEVFILAVVVAAWQLGPVSEFMVGSACESLKDMFAQLVYYGILKAEDAQCFRVDSLVASGSFVLAAGALLLTLLNVFVRMAGNQYLRDVEGFPCVSIAGLEEESDAELIDKIEPAPVLFTDRFRWAMTGEERPRRTKLDESLQSKSSAAESDAASSASYEWSDLPSRMDDYSISACASRDTEN